MYKIMLVDDEENIIKSLKRVLRGQKEWEIESFSSADEALRRATVCVFDVVISDYRMPGMNGVDFLAEMKELQPDAMRILLTGTNDIQIVVSSINKASAFRYINKPWDDKELIDCIFEAIKIRNEKVSHRFLAERSKEYVRTGVITNHVEPQCIFKTNNDESPYYL